MAKLIREFITESKITEGPDKKLWLEGIVAQGNIINQNRRRYSTDILDKEIARYTKDIIETNIAWGELDHPQGPNINMDRVSHRFVSVRREGNDFIAKALVTNTPMGNILRGLHESGGRIGMSTRGMGSMVENTECSDVCEDYQIVTLADAVANPSAPNAFVNGIMEGKEWVLEGGIYKEVQMEAAKRAILAAPKRKLDEVKMAEYAKFIQALKS